MWRKKIGRQKLLQIEKDIDIDADMDINIEAHLVIEKPIQRQTQREIEIDRHRDDKLIKLLIQIRMRSIKKCIQIWIWRQ